MLILLLSALCIILLILLYRYMPNHKIFYCFSLTLVLAASIAYFANQPREETAVLTEEQKYELQIQQKIFMDWYAGYQKVLTQLDRHWQWYHAIVEDYQAGQIDTQTVYVRLKQLEEDSHLLCDEIHSMAPPQAMHDPCYDLLIIVMDKTTAYADAQLRTIILSRAVTDPDHLQTDDTEAQLRSLEDVMVRESPAGLFPENEISQIRNYLTIPGVDTPEKEEPDSAA